MNVGNYLGTTLTLLSISEITLEKSLTSVVNGKAFSLKYNVIEHQKIHTVERLYECTEYGKAFIRKSHLIQQQKIHIEGFFMKKI